MSEDKGVSDATVVDSDPIIENKDAQVSLKAYENVTKDMHKNKQKAKSLEAENNELRAQMKAQDEQKMQEKQQWKELYEKREAELVQAQKEAKDKDELYTRSSKLAALKQEIGGNIRDEYLQFAELSDISITDGIVDKDSLLDVANSFRKKHGPLIPQSDNVNITGQAPNSSNVSTQKDFSKMSSSELIQEYAKQKNNQ